MTEVDIDQQTTSRVSFHGATVDDVDRLMAGETCPTNAPGRESMELSHHGLLHIIVHHTVAEDLEFPERDESFGCAVPGQCLNDILCQSTWDLVTVNEPHVVRDCLILVGR